MHRAGLSPAASPAPLQGTGKRGRNQQIWGTAFADPPCGPHGDEIIPIDLPKAGLFVVFNIQSYARDPGRKRATSSRSEQGSSRGREGTRRKGRGRWLSASMESRRKRVPGWRPGLQFLTEAALPGLLATSPSPPGTWERVNS